MDQISDRDWSPIQFDTHRKYLKKDSGYRKKPQMVAVEKMKCAIVEYAKKIMYEANDFAKKNGQKYETNCWTILSNRGTSNGQTQHTDFPPPHHEDCDKLYKSKRLRKRDRDIYIDINDPDITIPFTD